MPYASLKSETSIYMGYMYYIKNQYISILKRKKKKKKNTFLPPTRDFELKDAQVILIISPVKMWWLKYSHYFSNKNK